MNQKKTTIEELKQVAKERNHTLIEYTPNERRAETVTQHSRVTLYCQQCQYTWETRLQTYLTRTAVSGGCRQCFNNNIQDRDVYPKSPFALQDTTIDRPPRRVGQKILRQVFANGPYGFMQTREDLIQYLEDNTNDHNTYALGLVQRDTDFPKKRAELPVGQYSFHHVIPLHAKGSPDQWNIIYVTKEEHHKIHELRYLVYQDPKDKKATYATLADLRTVSDSESSSVVSEESSDEGP